MKIIITKFFEKKFNKISSDFSLDLLINKININSKLFISLKKPFYKLKLTTANNTYRVLINYEKDITTILLINIFNKKDKTFGENISWNLDKKEIINFYEKNIEDIEKGNFYKIEK